MAFSATNYPTVVNSTCTALLGDNTGLAIEAIGTGTPPTTAGIFQVGCRFIRTDQAAGLSPLYSMTGTTASPVWVLGAIASNPANGINSMNVAHAIYSFATDGGGAPGLITPALNATIPANAILVGATINPTTAVTSGGTTTVSIGTSAGSSASSILAATAKASFTTDALLNGVPTFAVPVKMSAAGSITLTSATTAISAGIVEIFVYYTVAQNA